MLSVNSETREVGAADIFKIDAGTAIHLENGQETELEVLEVIRQLSPETDHLLGNIN